MRFLAAQHGYRESLAQRGPRLHAGYRDVQDIPRDCAHGVRRELRRCCVPPCCTAQLAAPEEGGVRCCEVCCGGEMLK